MSARLQSISSTEQDEHIKTKWSSLFFLLLSETLKQKKIIDGAGWCPPSQRTLPMHGLPNSCRLSQRIWLSQIILCISHFCKCLQVYLWIYYYISFISFSFFYPEIPQEDLKDETRTPTLHVLKLITQYLHCALWSKLYSQHFNTVNDKIVGGEKNQKTQFHDQRQWWKLIPGF